MPKGITGSSDALLHHPMTWRKFPKVALLPGLIIMGYFDEEKNIDVIKDFHATATIGTPKVDKSQDLISSKLTKKDGFVMLQFKRNIVSSDKVSISVAVQRVLALCYFWNLEKVALAKNRISKISILCTQ